MNPDQFSAYLAVTVPMAVALVAEKMNLDEISATENFYCSKVYEALSDESTKAWHYGPMLLYSLFEEEINTGDFTWPEEACI
ncbi:MAG: hypothetical protein Q4G69_12920 [Planctomycetia bacterium]|nr:hypothetical protein [Planctomycetia bacterium]